MKPWTLGDETAMVPPPYVIKTTPCGYPGRYIRLTKEFIRFGKKVIDIAGEPKKVEIKYSSIFNVVRRFCLYFNRKLLASGRS